MDDTVADTAMIVLDRIRGNRARMEARKEDQHAQRIENILREVGARPGLDRELARAAAQYQRKTL